MHPAVRLIASFVAAAIFSGCATARVDGFLGTVARQHDETHLLEMRPHVRGRIPVVFVHGTASSAARWDEMVRELDRDPRIRDRFEPWFFAYNWSSPPLYSSYLLRRALTDAVEAIDPDGTDRELREMVVVGHSQGGLLAKMTSIRSETRFWDGISAKPFEETAMSDRDRELLGAVLFVEPLPFVRSLVFICTPHQGSFLATVDSMRGLGMHLISLPARVTRWAASVFTPHADYASMRSIRGLNAVENMAPSSGFVRTLSTLHVVPEVTTYSIVSVSGNGPVKSGNDGVVRYSSAHLDDAESELVVRSPHSNLSVPATIEEVRRILLEVATTTPGQFAAMNPVTGLTAVQASVAPHEQPILTR